MPMKDGRLYIFTTSTSLIWRLPTPTRLSSSMLRLTFCGCAATVLEKLGKFEEALADLTRADIALRDRANGSDAGERLHIGKLNRKLKHYDAALADFNDVLAITPNQTDALGQKVLTLLELGRRGEADAELTKLRRINPKSASGCRTRSLRSRARLQPRRPSRWQPA